MDITNYNQAFNSLNPQNSNEAASIQKENPAEKNETCWYDDAADAVGEALSDMDSFLVMFRQQQTNPQ